METLRTFRHEYKFIISYDEMLLLRKKLNELINIDRDPNGYMVRSLYFDSLGDNDYYDKLDGVINRKKIRLRIYDVNTKKVKIEIKSKYDYHQLKESLIISRCDALELINGNYELLLSYDNDVARKIYLFLVEENYRPKVVIEYQRIAYMTGNNTRITFDYSIKKSNDVKRFFDKDINYIDITNHQDVILEVKFDRFLEPYISNVLSKYVARYQSVSKYIMGRNI